MVLALLILAVVPPAENSRFLGDRIRTGQAILPGQYITAGTG